MELRLQQFIESVEVLADIRNLDQFNPIVFQLEHPVTATRYTIVGAKVAPSYLGIPVNTTWVVLDPLSQYYRMALKLVSQNDPDKSTVLSPVNLEADVNGDTVVNEDDLLYWNIVRTYDEIFKDPQYYVSGGIGPKGDKGDAGDPGVVDYNLALGMLASMTGTLEIQGPSEVTFGDPAAIYSVFLTQKEILADGTIVGPETNQVTTPIILTGNVPAGAYMDANNNLIMGEPLHNNNIIIGLYATYPSWGKSVAIVKQVTLRKGLTPLLSNIVVNGPSNVDSGTSAQFSLTATWDDGSTTTPSGTWSLNSTSYGSIDASGTLTVPSSISSSGSVNVSSTLILDGVTYTPNKTITVTKTVVAPTVTGVSVSGPSNVNSSTTGQYSVNVTWSNGSTTHPAATWSLDSTSYGSISSNGLLSVPSTIAGSGSVNVIADIVVDGNSYAPSKTVTVTKVVAAPTVTGATVSGPSAIDSGTSGQYTLTLAWSDGTTTSPAANWSLSSTMFGTINSSGTLTVPSSISSSGTVTVTGSVVVNGQTYTATKSGVAITRIVVAPTVTGVTVSGPANVNSGATGQYVVDVSWSNGTTTNPSASSWSIDNATAGTISAGGLLTVPSDLAANGNATITANVTVNGTAYTPTKAITVSKVVAPTFQLRFGISSANPADKNAMVNAFTLVAPVMTTPVSYAGQYNVSTDIVGSSNYLWFAYPASKGRATVTDIGSAFQGGFGGAGNTGSGPSNATMNDPSYRDVGILANITINGVTEQWYLYRTDYPNLGSAASNNYAVALDNP